MDSNQLRGNPGQRKPKLRQYGPISAKAPDWLSTKAKYYWKTFAPPLEREGILNEATVSLVATMCESFTTYLTALSHLKEEGRVVTTDKGLAKVNPWCAIEKQSWEMFVRGHKELKICGEPIKPQVDELEQFLNEAE